MPCFVFDFIRWAGSKLQTVQPSFQHTANRFGMLPVVIVPDIYYQ
jgi:hypothetical protein